MRLIARFSGAAVAGVALLSGCGSSGTLSSTAQTSSPVQPSINSSTAASPPPTTQASTSSATATSVDPCTVVSAAEIQSATGKTIRGAPKRANDFLCQFSTSDGGTVNFTIASPVTADNFQSHAQGQPPVPGIGDKAYQTSFGVTVLVGRTSVTVEVFPVAGGNYLGPTLKLARLVISRL